MNFITEITLTQYAYCIMCVFFAKNCHFWTYLAVKYAGFGSERREIVGNHA